MKRRQVPILLARHGETADNADGLILGRRDPPPPSSISVDLCG
jgi:broad specificity phosphatase PhoE